jgi:peptide-N4-(N-acetyl-beta-glucosaminyl)asparagine amidase
MSKTDRRRLMKEDEREERELRGYMAAALVAEINGLLPRSLVGGGRSDRTDPDDKHPGSRQETTAEWLNTRQRNPGNSGPDRGPTDGR